MRPERSMIETDDNTRDVARAYGDKSSKQHSSAKRSILPTVVGNWFEVYDFSIYALFAVPIGRAFFPSASVAVQLQLAFATFAASFLMRPIGAIVIGRYADRVGRKPALTLTIVLMALGTALLGLTPSYAQIGIAAPLIVVFARLLQGFSAGGELGTATTYLIEIAPRGRRGLYGSWQYASQGLALVAASLIGFGLARVLPSDAMHAWGWRIPFLIGVLIAPVGVYIRKNLTETAHEGSAMPLKALISEHRGMMVSGILSIIGGTSAAYVVGSYMTTYAQHVLHLPFSTGMFVNIVGGFSVFIGAVTGGWLSDKFGRRCLMIMPRLIFLLVVYPAFFLITHAGTFVSLMLMVALLSVLSAMSTSVLLVALPECFPRAIRTSGSSIVNSIGVTLFGGSAPLIVTQLIESTGDRIAPAWYLVFTSLVTLIALTRLRVPMANAPLE